MISQDRELERFEVVQPAYSLISREIEQQIIPLCRERQLSIITYSPLAAGFLSGKYQPDHQTIPRGSRFDIKPGHIDRYFKADNFRLLERLRVLSNEMGIPMARLAVGWVFQNPQLTSVLIGATSLSHVDNGLEAMGMEFRPEWVDTLLEK